MKKTCLIIIISSLVLLSCKTNNRVERTNPILHSIELAAYEGNYTTEHISNPNTTINISKNIMLIQDQSLSIITNKSILLDTINREDYKWKTVSINEKDDIIFNDIKIQEILFVEKINTNKL